MKTMVEKNKCGDLKVYEDNVWYYKELFFVFRRGSDEASNISHHQINKVK